MRFAPLEAKEATLARVRALIASGLILLAVTPACRAQAPSAIGGQDAAQAPLPETDSLPSWNEGPARRAILDFVTRVTTEGSPDFVKAAERIAVFDNDGTLWPENPMPFQLAFALDELARLAPDHPEWRERPMIQAALRGDVAALIAGGVPALAEVVEITHAGMTLDEFQGRVRQWLQTARHPQFGRPYVELAYQPMLELLAHLRSHGFRTYIVSGGGLDFMRVWAEEVYGIPPEQVIGSYSALHYELRGDQPTLVKDARIELFDDKDGKPVAIQRFIGRRPIACFGNSDGDQAMLEWTTVGRTPSLGLLVRHTDADREYSYDARPRSTGKLVEALAAAPRRGWIVVDMQHDWRAVFRPVR